MLILRLARKDAAALAPHRTRADWGLCADGDALWLRCPADSEAACAALPCVARYRSDARGLLTPLPGTVPVAAAPPGPWRALTDFLTIQPAAAAMPGRGAGKVAVALVRSEETQPAEALLLSVPDLLPWVEQAPRVRLERLQFAAAADGRAFVRGRPLPQLAGAAFYFRGALAVPCGWDFAPHVWPGWLEQAIGLAPGMAALVHEDAQMEVIGAEGFTPLTLAAVRRTLRAETSALP